MSVNSTIKESLQLRNALTLNAKHDHDQVNHFYNNSLESAFIWIVESIVNGCTLTIISKATITNNKTAQLSATTLKQTEASRLLYRPTHPQYFPYFLLQQDVQYPPNIGGLKRVSGVNDRRGEG